jgi:hypothetical protein
MYVCSLNCPFYAFRPFSIGFFFWPFNLWLLRLLFSHWQLGLLEVVDQGDAQ